MSPERRRWLLGLLGVLLALRLLLVPLLGWQNDRRDDNRNLAGSIARAERLLEDEQSAERITALQARVEALEARIPTGRTDLETQIELNTLLEDSLAAHGLTETSRAWTFYDESPRLAEVRIAATGHFFDAARWLQTLEAQQQPLSVAELQINRGRDERVSIVVRLRQRILHAPAS